MEVRAITLDNFRNWSHLELQLDAGGVTFIVGNNGQGKTNVLEGIYFAIRNKSFRVPFRETLITHGEKYLKVKSDVFTQGRVIDTEALVLKEGDSSFKVNSKQLRGSQSLLSTFPAVVFQPEDLNLVKGGPNLRRELLDELIVVRGKKSSSTVMLFERTLRQRNSLLKQAHGRLTQDVQDTLAVWDDRLSHLGEELACLRENVSKAIGKWLIEAYSLVAKESMDLTITYRRSWDGDLQRALRDSLSTDLQRGTTSVGPHRDDLDLLLGGKVARYHASQGEARAIAVASRLATVLFLQEELESMPVILLDDVISELDDVRATRLFNSIPRSQVIVTGTHLPKGFEVGRVLKVKDGRIENAL